jgi:hypothetical protein
LKLNYYKDNWALDVSECPCDVHFVDYLRSRRLRGKSIFHFGTGSHHVVAVENAKQRKPSHVLGVTASKQEYESYIDLVVAKPELANTYKAMFVDIYTLEPRLLPEFDVVSLFHLGEFHDPVRQKYAPLDDRKLLALMVRKLKPGGRVCFYRGSNGWAKSEPIVTAFIKAGKLAKPETYKSLLICRRSAAARR